MNKYGKLIGCLIALVATSFLAAPLTTYAKTKTHKTDTCKQTCKKSTDKDCVKKCNKNTKK